MFAPARIPSDTLESNSNHPEAFMQLDTKSLDVDVAKPPRLVGSETTDFNPLGKSQEGSLIYDSV